MKLKTLKDLQWDESGKGDYMVDGKELKEEAIKWVKWYLDVYKTDYHLQPFIKFHNITEEDLNAK